VENGVCPRSSDGKTETQGTGGPEYREKKPDRSVAVPEFLEFFIRQYDRIVFFFLRGLCVLASSLVWYGFWTEGHEGNEVKKITDEQVAVKAVRAWDEIFIPYSFVNFVNFCSKVFEFSDFRVGFGGPRRLDHTLRASQVEFDQLDQIDQIQNMRKTLQKRELDQLDQLFFENIKRGDLWSRDPA
jgi:hypothetical protein